jgi:hypothetical protein
VKLLFLVQHFRQGWGGAPESVRLMARRLSALGLSCDVNDSGFLHCDVEALEVLPAEGGATAPFDLAGIAGYAAVLQVGPWQHPGRMRSILSRLQPGQRRFYLPRGGLADIEFEGGRALKKRPYFALIERPFAARADAIVYSSTAEMGETSRLAGCTAAKAIIPDFFEWTPPAGATGPDGGSLTLGFLGEISPRKGLLPFVRSLLAWADGRAFERPVRLIVGGRPRVGAEGYYEEVRRLCRDAHGLGIDFAGPIRQDERDTFYGKVDVFFAPSLFESYGLTVLEAAGAGCAVICGPNLGVLEQLPPTVDVAVLGDLSAGALGGALDRCVAMAPRTGVERLAAAARAKGAIEEINARAARAWLDLLPPL